MIALFYGGASSGKSSLAENFAVAKNAEIAIKSKSQHENKKLTYLATMIPFGKEGARRIENHKKKREGKGFDVCEKFTNIGEAEISSGTVLLECVGNLLANEMFREEKKADVADFVLQSVKQLSEKCDNLILVSSDLSDGCENPSKETLEYIKINEKINKMICEIADEVYRVCVGIAIKEK